MAWKKRSHAPASTHPVESGTTVKEWGWEDASLVDSVVAAGTLHLYSSHTEVEVGSADVTVNLQARDIITGRYSLITW